MSGRYWNNDRFPKACSMRHSEDPVVLTIATTVGSLEAARTLARQILADGLAACVQLDPGVTSLYRWKGKLRDEPAVRLLIKTLAASEEPLQALFARHHPYEVPQCLVTEMRPSPAYEEWVRAEVVVPPG